MLADLVALVVLNILPISLCYFPGQERFPRLLQVTTRLEQPGSP
jgi:hypothetical protein